MAEAGWLSALRQVCADGSQAAVAKRLGVSPSMINQALKGVYKGDIERLRGLVEGAYLNQTVRCPVIGDIGLDVCLHHQAEPFKPVNPLRVKLYRACRGGCPHSRLQKEI